MRHRHAARSWRCGAAGAAEPGAEASAAQQAARPGGGEGLEALRRDLLATDLNSMLMPELKKVCRRAGLTLKGAGLLRRSSVPPKSERASSWLELCGFVQRFWEACQGGLRSGLCILRVPAALCVALPSLGTPQAEEA